MKDEGPFWDSRAILQDANAWVRLMVPYAQQWAEKPHDAPYIHCLVQAIVDHVSRPLADACVEIGLLKARLEEAEREIAELRKAHAWIGAKPDGERSEP